MTFPTLKQATLTGRCTSCRKLFQLDDRMLAEASEMGCAFSPCCGGVATIEKVEVKLPKGVKA